MAVPKRKTSKSKRNMRRSHHGLKMPSLSACPQCHEPVLPHHICPECGVYKGRTIIKTKES